MAFRKKGLRRITVKEEQFFWKVTNKSIAIDTNTNNEIYYLVIQSENRTRKIIARFYGMGIEFLFSGKKQNIVITPRHVREMIIYVLDKGWKKDVVLDYAEQKFPEVVEKFDLVDIQISAAAEQHFVPYPGRKEIQNCFTRFEGNISKISQSFQGVSEEQIIHWIKLLGIEQGS